MSAVTGAVPTAKAILADDASSLWIRSALTSALERDPVDALNDALALAAALDVHLQSVLQLFETD